MRKCVRGLAVMALGVLAACGREEVRTERPAAAVTTNTASGGWSAMLTSARHVCGLSTAGAMQCWGAASADTFVAAPPVMLSGARPWRALAIAPLAACGIASDGTSWCRSTEPAERYVADEEYALPVATLRTITLGAEHGCGIATDSAAYCWGNDSYGQLGIVARQDTARAYVSPPRKVLGDHHFPTIVASGASTCALDGAGAVYCWGDDNHGALLAAPVRRSCSSLSYHDEEGDLEVRAEGCAVVPAPVATSLRFARLAIGGPDCGQMGAAPCAMGPGPRSICGITAAGALFCWGVLPDGRAVRVPTAIEPGQSFAELSVGRAFVCAVTVAGAVRCVGRDGAAAPRFADTARVTSISVAGVHACAVITSGDAYCWGNGTVDAPGREASDGSGILRMPAPNGKAKTP